jgi:hypothetical protein
MPLRISRLDLGGRPLPSSRVLCLGNMGSIRAHCSSDNSSRLAMYEMYMTELQSTSHFFIFETASRSYLKDSHNCHSVPMGSLRETERSGVPSGESMTMIHLESTRLPCHGCFSRQSRSSRCDPFGRCLRQMRRDQHDMYGCFLHGNHC